MNVQLTEQIIRDRANDQSFQKGLEYYRSGAIYNPTWQPTPGGVVLMANCEGSSAPSYRLRVELDASGVRSASCTCPYDWGGDCKHIVALLLMYLHQPGEFSEQKSVTDLLSGMEKDALVALIIRLVERDPDLYDELEMALPAVKVVTQSSDAKERRQTQISEQTYRKQIKKILKQSRYDDDYYAEESEPAYLDDLEEVLQTAGQFLDAGDADGALIILRVLLEEITDDYDGDMDYNGDLAAFIQSLGMPLAEAILSAEMDARSHKTLQGSMQKIFDNLDEAIEDIELEIILFALEYGWDELPNQETQSDQYAEEDWMLFGALHQARLNVLERQGRTDEFLQLAQKADTHRYTLKLLQLGRVDEAVLASQKLEGDREILSVAQILRDVGRLNEAIALAERGLDKKGYHAYELATWLAPLEESQGRKEMALLAYRTAFDARPTLDLYRHLKRLSGLNWENLRPVLMQKVNETQMPDTLVEIHLEEHDWDAAIAVAEKQTWSLHLLEKVAEVVIPNRSDWVIRVSLKQSDDLIAKTQSNLYPAAAKWLARAKKAYQHKGQMADWQAYIENLRATYARRPALQKAIAGL